MSSCPQVLCISGCWDSCICSSIISTKWLPKYLHAHGCCEYGGCCGQIDWLDRRDHRNVIMSIGAVYQWMLWQQHLLKDNINKVIAEMSPCLQVLWIRWMLKKVHPVEDIGISPWPVDVVEFGDGGRCVCPQNRVWKADNIANGKQRSETWA